MKVLDSRIIVVQSKALPDDKDQGAKVHWFWTGTEWSRVKDLAAVLDPVEARDLSSALWAARGAVRLPPDAEKVYIYGLDWTAESMLAENDIQLRLMRGGK